MTDPLSSTRRMVYDPRGRLIKSIDPLNQATAFAYNGSDKITAITDALGGATAMAYDPDGNLISRTDAEGVTTRYEYDSEGRLTATVDSADNRIVYEYGSDGGCSSCALSGSGDRPIKITFPTFVRILTYDIHGRVIEQIDRDSDGERVSRYDYDKNGNLIRKTDPEGRVTGYDYDGINRLVRLSDPAGGHTVFTYDGRDNLLAITDANGNTTTYTYDLDNNLTGETRPGGETIKYTYDQSGRLQARTDALGNRREYAYDAAGRLTEERFYPPTSPDTPEQTVTFTYDAAGRLSKYHDSSGTSATYSYDALGRKTLESMNYGPFSLAQSYSYYKDSHKKTFTDAEGRVYNYTYNQTGRLAGIEIPGQGLVTINSYQWTSPSQKTLPGGARINTSYDNFMRLTATTTTGPAGDTLMEFSYTHNLAGEITALSTPQGNHAYGYDQAGRLTTAENPATPDESYTYDPVGNRLSAAGVIDQWVYNKNNELESAGSVTFTYDANGSTTGRAVNGVITHKYTYNAAGRMKAVTDGSGAAIAAYGYDPFGRRIWKEAGGTRTYYLYSDNGLTGEYNETGNEIKTYGWAPGSGWGTGPQFMEEAGQYYWYLTDHLGTPQKMINSSGQVVWSASYENFGRAVVDSSSVVENNLRFPGQYFDAETGLHYNWHRYYDPWAGRYMTVDPIGVTGGMNLYAYVKNDPVSLIDPYGLYSWQQGLQDTASYSAIASAASTFVPGGQVAAVVFAGVGTVATVTERVLYPKDPLDPAIDLLKISTPTPGGPLIGMWKDKMIDLTHEAYKRDKKSVSDHEKYNSKKCHD